MNRAELWQTLGGIASAESLADFRPLVHNLTAGLSEEGRKEVLEYLMFVVACFGHGAVQEHFGAFCCLCHMDDHGVRPIITPYEEEQKADMLPETLTFVRPAPQPLPEPEPPAGDTLTFLVPPEWWKKGGSS